MSADVITGLDIEESQENESKRLEFERKENYIQTFAGVGDEIYVLGVLMTVVAIENSDMGLILFGLQCYSDNELSHIRCVYRLQTNEIKFIELGYDELQLVAKSDR